MQCTLVCVVVVVGVCVSRFPENPCLGVRLGSEAGGPGSRTAAGSSARCPVTQTPKIALPFRERGEETRSRWPRGLPGLILQVRKVRLQPNSG